MGGRILPFLHRLCLFGRKTAEEPDESGALLPKNAVGRPELEHSQETRSGFQNHAHNVDDDDDDDDAEAVQPGPPKESFLLVPYGPDPFISLMKYFMFIINSAFFTLGLVILCVGFWGLSTKQSLVGEKIGYLGTDPMLAFILVGLMTCSLSFSGCVGFIRENACLLKTFVVGMAVVITAQCLVAIAALCFQQQIRDSLKGAMTVAMSRYHDDSDLKFILDEFQMAMECCGVESYQDWSVDLYFNCTSPGVNSCGVPYSCCIDPLQNGTVPNTQCGFGALGMGDTAAGSLIYTGGCIPQLVLWIRRRIWDIAVLYGLLISMECVCIVFGQKVMQEIEAIKCRY